jgi:hypothetical protein
MSFDLGLEHESESASYIESAIEELEQTYHLVLLTDYFEESLILLKVSGPSSQTLLARLLEGFSENFHLSFISQAIFEL